MALHACSPVHRLSPNIGGGVASDNNNIIKGHPHHTPVAATPAHHLPGAGGDRHRQASPLEGTTSQPQHHIMTSSHLHAAAQSQSHGSHMAGHSSAFGLVHEVIHLFILFLILFYSNSFLIHHDRGNTSKCFYNTF